jgi:hypothetical protein
MKKNKFTYKKIMISLFITVVLLLSYTVAAVNNNREEQILKNINTTNMNDSIPYKGYLRIYIVEPTSRWNNYDGESYHFGFLDFAFNDLISIDYQNTYTDSIIWNGDQMGFGDITENNIMVMAAIFNQEIEEGFSNPPFGFEFEAHYIDAAAGVTPGNSESNTVSEGYTHTLFIEEATAGRCPYCPAMANALYSVYESGEYPFYFVALITEDRQYNVVNQVALDYLRNEYNLYGYPTAHIDGGKITIVGGYDNPDFYSNRIEKLGDRDVHELDFTLSLDWIGDSELKIDISITNNEELFNNPPEIPTITGPTNGAYGTEYTYEIMATDPDDNDLYYYIDWGNGSTDLVGPFGSGRTAKVDHIWNESGTYVIKVRSRDTYDEKSDWTTLEVSMPKKQIKTKFNIYSNFYPWIQNIINQIINKMG